MTTTYNINRNDWTLLNRDGYIERHGVAVHDYGDGTVRVARSLYRDDELTITPDADGDGCRIDHIGGAWYLTR